MKEDTMKRFVLALTVMLMVGESARAAKMYKNGGSAMNFSGRIEYSSPCQGKRTLADQRIQDGRQSKSRGHSMSSLLKSAGMCVWGCVSSTPKPKMIWPAASAVVGTTREREETSMDNRLHLNGNGPVDNALVGLNLYIDTHAQHATLLTRKGDCNGEGPPDVEDLFGVRSQHRRLRARAQGVA